MQSESRLIVVSGLLASRNRNLRCAPQAPLYTLLRCNANMDFAPFVAIPEVHG
jgi:hypothetical protein